jgi:hypothetical protein
MFGRVGRLLLVALVTEVGGALIDAGRGWIDRKLNPPAAPAPTRNPSETLEKEQVG